MMKKLLILFAAAAMISCQDNTGYTVKVEMPDLADSTLVIVQQLSGEVNNFDSVTLDGTGQGVMSGTVESPEMMYLGLKGQQMSAQLFMDNYNYTITGSLADPEIVANGGPQADFKEYLESTTSLQEQQQATLDKFYASQGSGVGEDSINKILEQYYAVMAEKELFDSAYMVQNPASVVSVFLLRGNYHSLEADDLEARLEAFDESVRDNRYYKRMYEHLETMKSVQIGQKYIDLELPDTEGNMMKLSDVAEKGVLLIDFWAAWCNPCRRANPGIVEIYNEFKDKGFDIVGVSLDRSRDAWLQAIEDDGLTWHHMSDLNYWQSEAAKKYAVISIPHTVLLDADGTIIARNLSKDELKEKLTELLGS